MRGCLCGVRCANLFFRTESKLPYFATCKSLVSSCSKSVLLGTVCFPPKTKAPAAHRVVRVGRKEAGNTACWSVLAPNLAFSVVGNDERSGQQTVPWLILISNCSGRFALIGSWVEIASEMGDALEEKLQDKGRKQGTMGNSRMERSCDACICIFQNLGALWSHPPQITLALPPEFRRFAVAEAVPVQSGTSGLVSPSTMPSSRVGIRSCQHFSSESHDDDLIRPNHQAHAGQAALTRIVRVWRSCTSNFFISLQRLFFPSFVTSFLSPSQGG